MSASLIAVVTVIYVLAACVLLWRDGKPGMAIVFAGYALANVGMIWDLMRK